MRRRGTTTPRGLSVRVTAGFVAAGLAAGVVAGGLAGCTGEPREPSWTPTKWTPEQTVEPSPTPTPTPTDPAAVPPERPVAMDTVDTAGAEAVAAYYLRLVPYAEATGDTSVLRALSHAECIFCASVLEGVEALVAVGHHNTGGLARISEVNALEVDPGRWWTVDLELVQDPIQVLDAAGSVVASGQPDAIAFHMDVAVIYGAEGWRVRAVDFQVTEAAVQ